MAIHPEALLISAIIRTGEYQLLASQGIDSSMFHVYQDEMQWIEKYIRKASRVPSKPALKQQFPSFVVYKVDDTSHWCDEVRKEHKRQALVDLMDEAMLALDSDDEDRALDLMNRGVKGIQMHSGGIKQNFDLFEDWGEIYSEVSERVDRFRAKGFSGIPSGFPTLDGITGGFQPGWFIVLAARLGQGKTWNGIRCAWEAATTDHRVAYFSLEQPKFQIATRVHAFGSRKYAKEVFNPLDLNKGRGVDLRSYKKFLLDLQAKKGNGQFLINDTSRGVVTPASIAGVIEKDQPDMVIIDYLTLLKRVKEDWQGVADLSSEIQSMAKTYNIPIIGLSQINRLGAGKTPPSADNLSQADALGQDADLVITHAQQSLRLMKYRIAKFRHGPGGDIMWDAKFSPGTGEIEEVSQQEADDIYEEDNEDD